MVSHTVTISASPGGNVTPLGTAHVLEGETLSILVVPSEGFVVEFVNGCGGALVGSQFETAPIVSACTVSAKFARRSVTVTATASGSGEIAPGGALSAFPGENLVFSLSPRVPDCSITVGGSCGGQLSEDGQSLALRIPEEDCTLQAVFDCGPSTFVIRPENVGIFWEIPTQQMTATEVFDSGEEVDVTGLVTWSTSDETVLDIDRTGLATAVVDHGILTVTARDPQHPPSSAATTSATIMNVTEWRNPVWELGPEYMDAVVDYASGDVYLDNVQFTSETMSWDWTPRPWVPFPNTISGFLWAFWSEDGGATFNALMWDYVSNQSTGKSLGRGMPTAWMGTMLSTVCDKKPDECNGRERTNVYFATHPGPYYPYGS